MPYTETSEMMNEQFIKKWGLPDYDQAFHYVYGFIMTNTEFSLL